MIAATQLSRLAIIDLEASGLGSASFPIEIGWALPDDGSLAFGACLIRPAAKWLLHDNAWSPAAERLTRTNRRTLRRDALAPAEALARFEAVGDVIGILDEPLL